ncbi:hypothetical protein AC578_1705 [Pseudocercospora eumusae]|uniref:Zn(2)-C6 fungal-type domain-containing protein n=1 Tax=Pseudocercospora eumusae TaxID=321146 RepID=A0A139GV20_9PEZI|nr:hypothetical protein AC578_1705 [Pseudocercospora eumusae]
MSAGRALELTSRLPDRSNTKNTNANTNASCERRACDACFKLKEKCVFAPRNDDCDRCRRLHRKCTSDRPIRPSGRPRKERSLRVRMDSSTLRSLSQGTPLELTPFAVLAKHLNPIEEFMFRHFLDSTHFNRLMIAPRVGQAMHREATFSLLHNYDDINDGYFSMYGSFAQAMGLDIPGFEPEANTARGSKALKKFCDMKVPTTRRDFLPWMWLGTALTIHTHCLLGTNAAPIRRYILSHVKNMAEQGLETRTHPVILITLSLDAVDSLLKRELPITGYPHGSTVVLKDEVLGLCAQLVDFIGDICKVSHAMARDGESAEHFEALDQIEANIQGCKPQVTPGMAETMTALEMAHFYAQVRVHRDAYMLIIHRLRYAFGMKDETGKMIAQNIMTDLGMTTSISGSHPNWVTLPYLVASIEMTGLEARRTALENVDLYIDGIHPAARTSTRAWLKAVWSKRDIGPGFKWLDVMDKLPTICVNHVGSVRDVPGQGRHCSVHNVSSVTLREVPTLADALELRRGEPSDGRCI